MAESDHAPLLLTCKHHQTKPRPMRFELFWLNQPAANEIVNRVWDSAVRPNSSGAGQLFDKKVQEMHGSLREWHDRNFGEMEAQLMFCKKALLFFDKIEEKKMLADYEFRLRNKIRERIYLLANIIETKWKQRSTCNWIKSGDKNTRFFHTFASARHMRNTIHKIKHEGVQMKDEGAIRDIFKEHMEGLLGTMVTVAKFDPTTLYPIETRLDLNFMAAPFSQEEVYSAVQELAKHKVSGTDGLPNEFLQTHRSVLKE